MKTFFGDDNNIKLTSGGSFEIYFMMDAPPQFREIREHPYKTWVVVLFGPIDEQQTEVKLVHLGWPEDVRRNPVYDFFNAAWDIT